MLEKINSSRGDAFISPSLSKQNNAERHSNFLHGKFSNARSVIQPQPTSISEDNQTKGISLANEFAAGVSIDRRTKLKNAIEKVAFLAPNPSKGEVGLVEHTKLEALDTGKHRIYSLLNIAHVQWEKTGQQQAGFFEWLDKNPDHKIPMFDPEKVIEEWEKNGKPGEDGPHVWARENVHDSAAAIAGYRNVRDIAQTKFLSGKEIGQYQATLKNGVWHRTDGKASLVDTMASPGKTSPAEYYPQHGVFVMHRNRNMYIHDYKRNEMHHPMTTGGAPVLASGIIKIENGVATSFALISGHYRCGLAELDIILKGMKDGGVNLRDMSITAPAIKDKEALQQLLKKYQ
ncbi:MAG: hypothetical protein V4754_01570 [Pseudomonadota bacterium]